MAKKDKTASAFSGSSTTEITVSGPHEHPVYVWKITEQPDFEAPQVISVFYDPTLDMAGIGMRNDAVMTFIGGTITELTAIFNWIRTFKSKAEEVDDGDGPSVEV